MCLMRVYMVPLTTEGSCISQDGLRGLYMVPLITEGSCKVIWQLVCLMCVYMVPFTTEVGGSNITSVPIG